MNKLRKNKKKSSIKLRDEFKKHEIDDNFDVFNKIKTDNNIMINKIDKDLILIEKSKNDNLRELFPIKYKERPYTARKPISPSFKPHRSMEHFTKIKGAKKSIFEYGDKNYLQLVF